MILKLSLFALVGIQAVAGAIGRIDLGNGIILQENSDGQGSTWFGRVPIDSNTFSYTVTGCEELAKKAYAGLREKLDSNINDPESANAIRMFGKVGVRSSSNNFLISAYTYDKSDFAWIGSLPRNVGLAQAKTNIAQKTTMLREAPSPGNPNKELFHRVHAEEQAWLTFETDEEEGLASPKAAAMRQAEGYPPGSVVGSAKAARRPKQSIPTVAEKWPACGVEDVATGASGTKNGGRACQLVAASLGVQFDDAIPAERPHRNPIGNDGISDHDLVDCFAEAGLQRRGKQCVKPSSAAPSQAAPASKASSIPAKLASSASKQAPLPSSAALTPTVSIPSRPKVASSVPPKAASNTAALPSSSAAKIVPSKQAPKKAASRNAAPPAVSSKVAPPSKAVSKPVAPSQAPPAKPVSPAAPAKPVTPAAPPAKSVPIKSVPTSFKTSVKPSSAVKVSPAKTPAQKPAPAPSAPKSKPAPAKPPKKGGK